MKFKLVNQLIAISTCGKYSVVKNYDDLYTPWRRDGEEWIHIDGRGCDTSAEAVRVCKRDSGLAS